MSDVSIRHGTKSRKTRAGHRHSDQLLSRLGHSLAGASSVADLAAIVKTGTLELWDWDAFVLLVRRAGQNRFQAALLIDTINGEKCESDPREYEVDSYFTLGNVMTGEAHLINRDFISETHALAAYGDTERLSASLIYSPIMSGRDVLGILSVQSYTRDRFNEADRVLTQRVCDAIGPALQRCRAEQSSAAFASLGHLLSKAKTSEEVARIVASVADELIGWDACLIDIYSPASGRLHTVYIVDTINDRRVENVPVAYTSTNPSPTAARTLQEGAQLILRDHGSTNGDKGLLAFGDKTRRSASLIFVPIHSGTERIGVLSVQSYRPQFYTAEDVKTIQALADHCGGALERTWAEAALRESERKYRMLVENVNDGILIAHNADFVYVNRRFADMLGYDPEEVLLLQHEDVYTPQGLEMILDRRHRRKQGKYVPSRYETPLRRKDGSHVYVEANVSVSFDTSGNLSTFAVFRDITERREAEARLRESEAELRALFTAMRDIILVIDADGRYLKIAPNNRELVLQTTDHFRLEGKTFRDIFDSETANELHQYLDQVLSTGETLQVEYRLALGGTENWYHASISPIEGNRVLWVAREITERKNTEGELFRTNARLQTLINASEDYIFVMDRDFRYIQVNDAINRRYGIDPGTRLGHTLYEVAPKAVADHYAGYVRQVFETDQSVRYDDFAVIEGREIYTETVLSPLPGPDGRTEAVVGVSREISARKVAEAALRDSEERYALALRGANDGLWDWNLRNDTVFYSDRWKAMLGFVPTEIGDSPDEWFGRVHPEDLPELRQNISANINGTTPHFEHEHRIQHNDGSYRWMLTRGTCVRNEDGKAYRLAGSQSDITVRKFAEEQLIHGAFHDALTGLPNRAYFMECLERAIAHGNRRENYQFAVLFLDIDRFKVVNDSVGHLIGDQLLVEIARRLEECIRPGDAIARLGGDEFTILLDDVKDASDAVRVAERIQTRLAMPFQLSGNEVFSSASIGIALSSAGYEKPEELLRDTDMAMYRAKAMGKARHVIFSREMHDNAMALLQMETDLRRALERGELCVHFQPVISIKTGAVVGFEALTRWQHPERGAICPDVFIPVAEETGLIGDIGRWVILESAQQLFKWHENSKFAHKPWVSVNISARHFAQPDLIGQVYHALLASNLEPQYLVLEITESAIMEQGKSTVELLRQLKKLNIQLFIDDFGTGYSSLSYLHQFPIDALKIDQSFVSSVTHGNDTSNIARAIIVLAHTLKLPVIAEGVETSEQLIKLQSFGCDYWQGYLFSTPCDAGSIEALLL